MLNVKYVIVPTGQGDVPITNPFANGNAWFVEKVKFVSSADQEMKVLDSLDTKREAVFNQIEIMKYSSNVPIYPKKIDSISAVNLEVYKPNYLKYISNSTDGGLAIFSENYYENGWKAYVDGNETRIFRANYVLRAIQLSAGKHTIEFKFEPEVVKTGSTIAFISSIGMLLLIGVGIYLERKKKI